MRIKHAYERAGVLQYLAAWDVHRAVASGRCEPETGKATFGRLLDGVIDQEPYRSARRVCWIVDNGSPHCGDPAAEELQARHPRIVIVHTPTYASWLNQIEIYFSIIQRKLLKPHDYNPAALRNWPTPDATPPSVSHSPGASPATTSNDACVSCRSSPKPRWSQRHETGPGIYGTHSLSLLSIDAGEPDFVAYTNSALSGRETALSVPIGEHPSDTPLIRSSASGTNTTPGHGVDGCRKSCASPPPGRALIGFRARGRLRLRPRAIIAAPKPRPAAARVHIRRNARHRHAGSGGGRVRLCCFGPAVATFISPNFISNARGVEQSARARKVVTFGPLAPRARCLLLPASYAVPSRS